MPLKFTAKVYDLNTLLRVANVLICSLTIYLYCNMKDENDYVNIFTIVLGGLFAIENIGMLSYEKRRRNPFILILVILMTVFYMARIATLTFMPASMLAYGVNFITASDINYTLIFILLSNASMFLGFHIGGKNNVIRENITCADDPAPKARNAIIIISLLVLVEFSNVISVEKFGRLSGFVQYIVNMQIIILFTFTSLIYHYKKISLRIRSLFIVIIVATVILITMAGGKGATLAVGILLVMSILAVKQRVIIRRKIILLSLILIPISIILFVTGSSKRSFAITNKILTVEQLYNFYEHEVYSFDCMEKSVGVIYNRLGFLDISTEIIANRQKFAKVVTAQYYIKSIIDNVLTPGFDVFDTVRVSHALKYVRLGEPIPDNKDQISLNYQADQMGIYGEYYVLFYGYPALVFFFLLAFMLQRVFHALETRNILLSCMYRAALLGLFYIYMNSFGTDWLALDIVSTVITTFLFARFYVSNRKGRVVFVIESK